jgi:hypothetical protein
MFGLIIRYYKIVGLEYKSIALVDHSYDAYVRGLEPREKLNGWWMTNVKADKVVYTAWDILNSALNVANYPGLLAFNGFNGEVVNTISIGGLCIADP